MDRCTSFGAYRMSDALWNQFKKLLPKYKVSPLGGRPRRDLRSIADAIFYRLKTGCQWKAIPPSLAPGSTAHEYFQEWVRHGVFDAFWQLALREYHDLVGFDWFWQSVDGAMTKAPLGQENTGPNPTDRAKKGTKRSIVTDGNGIPVGLAVAGANVHDSQLLRATVANCLERVPRLKGKCTEHLCMDKAYDSRAIRQMLQEEFGYTPHIRSRMEERVSKKQSSKYRPRRWVVERTHSWLNRFRGILIRWEKKAVNYLASLQLACAYYTLKQIPVSG